MILLLVLASEKFYAHEDYGADSHAYGISAEIIDITAAVVCQALAEFCADYLFFDRPMARMQPAANISTIDNIVLRFPLIFLPNVA